MNRREFTIRAAALASAVLLDPLPLGARAPSAAQPRVNGERLLRHLQALAEFGRTAEGGVSRVAYSEADREGRAYVLGLMRAAGLQTRIDAAGNLVGSRRGRQRNRPPLSIGSHIDSVPDGGNYDGPVGSLGAIEVVQTLVENRVTTRHPLEVLVFSNEEGGKTGSRALSGELEPRELDLATASGRTVREGIGFLGGDPDRLGEVRRRPGSVTAFLELHIEQGGVLESDAVDLGVVEGIVGIKRWEVTVEGVANHAGTTPMQQRRDALLAAARYVEAVNQVVTGRSGRQGGTVGRIQALPGAPNVIPGRVVASLELRDLEMSTIDHLLEEIIARTREIGGETGTSFAFETTYVSRSAPTDERIRRAIEAAAGELGLSTRRMPSGAGHDAQSMARLAPIGMIFVPSVGGISHSPREFTRPEDVVNGANALLHTLLRLDGAGLR
ncbi:MAG TPA: Zn-dependent hydrolase [Longimicrobiaceae bacterium]|nr:Zn-dependent hydrolase [Longimicrobiaceae bacterium]